MTDQEIILAALRQAGLIVAEYLESGSGNPQETITRLAAVLDTQELADAVTRFERGLGLRLVK